MEEREWHQYLREAFSRTVDTNRIIGTTVLFTKNHERYNQSQKWVSDEFKDMSESLKYGRESAYYTAMASSDPANLSELLKQIASEYKKGELLAGHLMLVIDP